MNRLSLVVAALGIGLALSPVLHSVTASAGPGGIGPVGVVDMEKILYETPAGTRAAAAFEKKRQVKQADFDKRQKDLQKAAAELDKQAAILKPDVLAQKKQELEKKFVELQEIYVKLERELAGDRASLIQDILKTATPQLDQIAKAEGVVMIVDQSAVLWATPTVDLTAKLAARMK